MDPEVKAIDDLLKAEYRPAHPHAVIDVQRRMRYVVEMRIIDRDFEGLDYAAREEMVWPLLKKLPSEIFQDITMVLLITPEERPKSFASLEFDYPATSLTFEP